MLETLDWRHFDLAQTYSDVELDDLILAFPDLYHPDLVLVYPDWWCSGLVLAFLGLCHLVLTNSDWCHSDLVLRNLILAGDLVGDCPILVFVACN